MHNQNLRIQDNIRASRASREASGFGGPGVIRIQDQEEELNRQRAQQREEHRRRFNEMMASPLSPNRTSATYDDILIGREEQSRRDYEQLREQFARREEAGNRRREERERRNSRIREMDELYRRDMLPDFDRRMEELLERYEGHRGRAEEKYKSELSRNLPAFFRDSKIFSKMSLKQTAGLIDAIGAFKTTGAAITAGFLALKTTFKTINEFTSAADDANVKLLGLDNLKNFYGGIGRNELNAALRAGMSPEEALSAHGNLIAKYGAIENILPVVKQFAGAGRIERMAMANELG
jgi:hypothetical protein